MKKGFWLFAVFLICVTVLAQQGGTELPDLPDDTSAQVLSAIDSTAQNSAGDEDSVLTLRISTDPTGAALKIGDRDYGLTPVTITDLDIGEYVLELSKRGHFRRRVTIQLDSAGADLHFELAAPASIFITSEPEGAQISFDGKQSGATPFQSERIRPGDYPVTLSIDGYELYETAVSLKSGVSDTLHIALESLEKKAVMQSNIQTAQIQQISQPQPESTKKSLFNKEHTRSGVVTIGFFIFVAILIGMEKTSY